MIRTIFPNLTLNPLAIILIILGFIIAWVIATYNKFVSLNQRVKQAQGGIDVYLKQRFDLIPNLVETVKGYTAHEKGLMENIAKLRNDYNVRNDQDITESQNLNDRYTKILAMLENYPELKADEAFLKLQKTLSKIESQLQAARRIYNSEVTEFNTKRYKFPSNIIAGVFGFKEKSLFEINESERGNVNINI
ncbi:MAG: LemA family protein [Clostridia bacterium]|nr:LemA family protein [Clostridia bacterium]